MMKYIFVLLSIVALISAQCTDQSKNTNCQDCTADSYECGSGEGVGASAQYCIAVNGTNTFCGLDDGDKICAFTDVIDPIPISDTSYTQAIFDTVQTAFDDANECGTNDNGKCCGDTCSSKDDCYCPTTCTSDPSEVTISSTVAKAGTSCRKDCECCFTKDFCETAAGYSDDSDCCKVGCGSSASALSAFWF